MKTPLVYFGGKQMLASTIISLLPNCEVYCEPYVGGGAVFWAKPPSKTEIINDLDGMIATFYKVLINDFKALQKRIDETLYDRTTHRYAWFIRKYAHLYTDIDIAWAFFTLSSVGFSGTLDSFGCYTKGSKAKTHEKRKTLFSKDMKQRIEGVQVENCDAVDLIKRRDSINTVFYCDPPYIDTCQSHYAGFTREHYKTLLDTLSNIKGKFLLSSFPSDILYEYIKKNGWYSFEINQVKSASRNPDGTRKRKTEVLTANYPIQQP